MTHKERLEKGLWYDANYNQEVLALRSRADELCLLFNQTLPSDTTKRSTLLTRLLPNMGEDVTILPGVQIGSGSVIGAGSVVTKDIPENVIAAGNPCHILRAVTERDRLSPQDYPQESDCI